ncbi:3-methyl-2-oxobutanoate hydroxymethyltransferase, partial [Nocardia carnea]|uniref:3-methyl-2-oxobutanoate hydroxymethyltransferase n=1 Tax=Nocardia carnea TaxID=37328 RepID=UPI003D77E245
MSDSAAETPAYGAAKSPGAADSAKPARRPTRVQHLQQMKATGERWAMLTAYDYSTARLFEEAGIPVLLIGDSAANVVYGYDTTVPITTDELIPLVRGVGGGGGGGARRPARRSRAVCSRSCSSPSPAVRCPDSTHWCRRGRRRNCWRRNRTP